MNDEELDKLSRSLAGILRHGAGERRINISQDGFVRVNDLLRLHRFSRAGRENIKKVVETSKHGDGMPRFELCQNRHGQRIIRATRKHSMLGVSVAEHVHQAATEHTSTNQLTSDVGPQQRNTAQDTDSRSPRANESDIVGVARAAFNGTEYEEWDPSNRYLSLHIGDSLCLPWYDTGLHNRWAFGRREDGASGWFPRDYFQRAQRAMLIPEHSGPSQVATEHTVTNQRTSDVNDTESDDSPELPEAPPPQECRATEHTSASSLCAQPDSDSTSGGRVSIQCLVGLNPKPEEMLMAELD